MKTNDIKKGAELRLTSNREAIMMDNKRGNIRMVEVLPVNGYFNDMGSIYATDILAVKVADQWVKVTR